MCFTSDDGDWTADIQEIDELPAEKPCKCYECGAEIQAGEVRIFCYFQEHENCTECESGYDTDIEPCPEGECDFGNTECFDVCMSCEKIGRAIEAVETERDCPPGSRRPLYGDLHGELCNLDEDERQEYLSRAVAMFPEIAGCKLLTIWDEES